LLVVILDGVAKKASCLMQFCIAKTCPPYSKLLPAPETLTIDTHKQ